MKATEYIAILKNTVEKHGDFDVKLSDDYNDSLKTVKIISLLLDIRRINILELEYKSLVALMQVLLSLNGESSQQIRDDAHGKLKNIENRVIEMFSEINELKDKYTIN